MQVTGVVGRAETLSSVFFLAAFILYSKATKCKKYTGKKNVKCYYKCRYVSVCFLFALYYFIFVVIILLLLQFYLHCNEITMTLMIV